MLDDHLGQTDANAGPHFSQFAASATCNWLLDILVKRYAVKDLLAGVVVLLFVEVVWWRLRCKGKTNQMLRIVEYKITNQNIRDLRELNLLRSKSENILRMKSKIEDGRFIKKQRIWSFPKNLTREIDALHKGRKGYSSEVWMAPTSPGWRRSQRSTTLFCLSGKCLDAMAMAGMTTWSLWTPSSSS